jgi:hypothetical protein
MKRRSSKVGQAGLIIMLVMVVLLTLGISIASRSTLDVSQSTQEAETSRVFDAAEAGIERALNTDVALTYTAEDFQVDDLVGSYTVSEINELEVSLDESQVVAVNTDGFSGDVLIEWSKVSNCSEDNPASIVVSVFDSTTGLVRRYAYAGCDHGDEFLAPNDSASSPYVYATTVTVTNDEDLIRVRPLYNETWLRATALNLPVQYHQISSKASNEVSGETRAIQVDRTIPTAPTIFDYVLFSGSTITKN